MEEHALREPQNNMDGMLALFEEDEEEKQALQADLGGRAPVLGQGHAVFVPADRRQGPGWAPLRNPADRRGWNDRVMPRINMRHIGQGHSGDIGYYVRQPVVAQTQRIIYE
jgi:hypothetical protein